MLTMLDSRDAATRPMHVTVAASGSCQYNFQVVCMRTRLTAIGILIDFYGK